MYAICDSSAWYRIQIEIGRILRPWMGCRYQVRRMERTRYRMPEARFKTDRCIQDLRLHFNLLTLMQSIPCNFLLNLLCLYEQRYC